MPSNPEYPEELEQTWLQIAGEATGRSVLRDAVSGLEADAERLSDAFTTNRDVSFSGYASSKRALAAYGLYFFPRAFVRTSRVIKECRRELDKKANKSAHIFDLGAGTGAAGLSVLREWSAWNPNIHLKLTCVDQAPEGLEIARDLFGAGRSLWPRAHIDIRTSDAQTFQPDDNCDLIICSFSINEWMEENGNEASHVEWVRGLMRSLRPGGLLVLLEPSQHESVDRMIRLRNILAEKSAGNIIAPCPHHHACPMHAEKRGWCHEVRHWHVPESLRWMNQKLQRDVNLLKFSFLAIQRGKPQEDPRSWMRIVSPVRKEKGKFVFHGCGADGQLHTCEWLNRKLSEEEMRLSEELERGDRVAWKNAKLLGDGKTERAGGPPGKVE